MSMPYTVERLALSGITPDLNQPRKLYDPERLEELKNSVRANGLLNKIIVERMTTGQYNAFMSEIPQSSLRDEYITAALNSGKGCHYVIVVGHRRWLGLRMAGYAEAEFKVVESLSMLERRQIQIQEDSQLPFPPYERAKAMVRLYENKQALFELQGLARLSIPDFATYLGETPKRVRERFRYVQNLDEAVKRLVEENGTLDYGRAVIISRAPKEDQLRIAANNGGLSAQKLAAYISKMYGEEKEEGELLSGNGNGHGKENGISGRIEQIKTVFSEINETMYRIMRLAEHQPGAASAMFREAHIDEAIPALSESLSCLEREILSGSGAKYMQMLKARNVSASRRDFENFRRLVERAQGLEAMHDLPGVAKGEVELIPMEKIVPDQNNPRGTVPEEGLDELANSIMSVGLLNPIYIEKLNGLYKIIAGERRFRANARTGRDIIEAYVLNDISPETRLELQIIEDSQVPFTPGERAESWANIYHLLCAQEGKKVPVTEFSRSIKKSETAVRSALKYELLSDEVKNLVDEGLLQYSAAVMLSSLPEEEQQLLALKALLGNYSPRELKAEMKEAKMRKAGNQQSFLDAESEEKLMEGAYLKWGRNFYNTWKFGIESEIRRLKDTEDRTRELMLANSGFIMAAYRTQKTLERITSLLDLGASQSL